MSKTQIALLLGEEQTFSVGEYVIPEPQPGEILVKIKSVALNPVDWKIQKIGIKKFGIPIEGYPTILGSDIAGDVEEVGEGIKDSQFKKGDKVFFQGIFENRRAGYQQYTIAVPQATAKIPANLTYDDVVALPVATSTPWFGFYNKDPYGWGLPLPNEDGSATSGEHSETPILIFGGANSIGQTAIQLAKISGFSPIIATASLKNAEYLKSLGATHIIDRNIPLTYLESELKKVTDKPLKYIFDGVSEAGTQQAGYNVLAPGGKIIFVLYPDIANKTEDKKIVHVLSSVTIPYNGPALEHLYQVISKLVETGKIKGGSPLRWLSGIVGGLKKLENNQVSGGKLVVHPFETV